MSSVIVYQDNLSCMALLAQGRSEGERYYWMKDRVERGEATIVQKGNSGLYANVTTKPLSVVSLFTSVGA
jgi:hypothetical protein